jgi:transposase InsO family protein
MSAEFQNFLKENGIHHETTVPHSPQQNGIAERMNRTLQEAALSMILHAGVSKSFWAEAVCSAAYIRNRVITTATGVTPYERWYGKKPDVSNFRVFGCTAYAHVPDSSRQKLDQKAVKMRFVGYSLTQKGYRLYDENKLVKSLSVEMLLSMKLTSDIRTEYNWRLRKRMTSALKKNQIRNHLIADVQREKESHQFIIMMNTLVSQQQSIQLSL